MILWESEQGKPAEDESQVAKTYSVMIVEDAPATRRRLTRAIEEYPRLVLLAAVGTCAEARAALAGALPKVLLVDIGLPDGNGIDLIREVAARSNDVDMMVITVFGDEKHVLAALQAGATGYLLKDSSLQDIGEAVMQLIEGGSPISPPIARYLLRRFHRPEHDEKVEADPNALTEREHEVLNLIVKGFSYKEIANLLKMSLLTVPSHIKNIYRKLAVHSRSEAVFEAIQTGLVRLEE